MWVTGRGLFTGDRSCRHRMEDGDPSPRFSLSADRRGRLAGRAGPVLRVAARSRDRGSGSASGPTRWSRGLAQQGRGRRMSRMLRRSWARRSVPFLTCRASPRSQGSKPNYQTQRHNVVRMTTSQLFMPLQIIHAHRNARTIPVQVDERRRQLEQAVSIGDGTARYTLERCQ